MRRKKCREQIFKLLFQVEFIEKQEYPEMIEMSFMPRALADEEIEAGDEEINEDSFTEQEKNYISEKFDRIVEKIPDLDVIINETAVDWSTKRMGKVELAILRLALYEMKEDEDIPESVAINEAVELAKKYGGNESYAFVNGILSKCAVNQEKRKENPNKKEKARVRKPVKPAKIVMKGSASKKE